jgi:hypothetical protein
MARVAAGVAVAHSLAVGPGLDLADAHVAFEREDRQVNNVGHSQRSGRARERDRRCCCHSTSMSLSAAPAARIDLSNTGYDLRDVLAALPKPPIR